LPLIRIDDVPWLEGGRSMTFMIFPIPVLNYEIKVQTTLT